MDGTNRNRVNTNGKPDDKDTIIVTGEVVENLPNTQFRVKLDDSFKNKLLICYLSGKMRKNYIKIMPGDKVTVNVSRYDLDRGRIVYRGK